MKNTQLEKYNYFLNFLNEQSAMYDELAKNEALKADRLKNKNKFEAINDVKKILKTRQELYDKKIFNEVDIYNDLLDCLDDESVMYNELVKNEPLKADKLKNCNKFEAVRDVRKIFKTIY